MSDAATQEIGTRRGDNSNVAVAPVTDIGVGGAGGGSSRTPFFASKRGSDAFSLTPLAWLASATTLVGLVLYALQQTLHLPSNFGIEDVLGWSSRESILEAVKTWCKFDDQRWRAGAAYVLIDTALFMPFYGLLILAAVRSMCGALQTEPAWVARLLAVGLWPSAWVCMVILWCVDALENFGGTQRLGIPGWAYAICIGFAAMLFVGFWRWVVDKAQAGVNRVTPVRKILTGAGLVLAVAAVMVLAVATVTALVLTLPACSPSAGSFDYGWAHWLKPKFVLLAFTPLAVAVLVWWFGMDLDSHMDLDPRTEWQRKLIISRAAQRAGAAGIIGRSRYILLALALFAVFTLVLDQCRDVLLALARPSEVKPSGATLAWQLVVLLLGAVAIAMLSYSCWLWARVIGMVKRPGLALPGDENVWMWLGEFARGWARALSLVPLLMFCILVAQVVGDAASAARSTDVSGVVKSYAYDPLPGTLGYLLVFGLGAVAIGGFLLWLRRSLRLTNPTAYYDSQENVYALLCGTALPWQERDARAAATAASTVPDKQLRSLWRRIKAHALRALKWLTLPMYLPLLALLLMGLLRLGMACLPDEAALAPATFALLCLSLSWWLGVAGAIALAEQRQAIPWGLFLLVVVGLIAYSGYGDNHIVPLNAPVDIAALPGVLKALRIGGFNVVAVLVALGAVLWLAATFSKTPDVPIRERKAVLRPFFARLSVALIAFVLALFAIRHFDGEHTALTNPPSPNETQTPVDVALYDQTRRLDDWTKQLGAAQSKDKPVFIVASEGGGIRSAYWTALVLAHLHERLPDFDRRTLALSGVSGGAIGEAVYRACLRQEKSSIIAKKQDAVLGCVTKGFKSFDALSPLVGGMMFEDVFARVLPLKMDGLALLNCTQPGCGYLSRALGFEREWMRKFAALADAIGPAQPGEPELLLNSTWVETGNRTVFSTLPFLQSQIPSAEDGVSRLGAQASLITAAHAAARFPFINPLGAMRKPFDSRAPDSKRPVMGHLADGGYFDNSGADSLADVLRLFDAKRQSSPTLALWQPHLLLIRNGQFKPGCAARSAEGPEPKCLNSAEIIGSQELLAKPLAQASSSLYVDLLGPAVAVVNVSGIGSHARQSAGELWATLSSSVTLLDQTDEGGLVPLGWYLSPAAREALEAQAEAIVKRLKIE